VRNPVDRIRDFAKQTQAILPNPRIVDHDEHLLEEAIDRCAQLLGHEPQRIGVASLSRGLADPVSNRPEAFSEGTLCAGFEKSWVDRAASAFFRDVEGAFERDRDRFELGRAAELRHGFDARAQVAQGGSVPGAEARVDDVCSVDVFENSPNSTAEKIVERRAKLIERRELGVVGICGVGIGQDLLQVDVERPFERNANDAERGASKRKRVGGPAGR